MGCMDQQRLRGEIDGCSRPSDLAVSVGNPSITPAGHTCCEPFPLGDTRPLLAAGISITRVLVLCPQPRWLDFHLDELIGQNKVSLAFVGVVDRASSRPGKAWQVLSGDLP